MSEATTLLKENLTLSALVGRYAKLVKKGGKLAACCPFHGEKTPSFYVDDKKGFYHCFGCGKGGDLIQFAQEIEGVSFVEALDFLADIAGIELPKRRGKRGPSRDLVEALRHINDDAVQFYQEQLKRNKQAMQYLLDRGMRESTVSLFKLGWAPGGFDVLWNHLSRKHDPKILVQQSGLFKVARNGNPYDLFRDRVIFPIRDVYGHTIAFGGRLIEGEGPKYINSPETPIYVKGKHVYNLDFAKVFLKKRPQVVVTEGYMDAIQVYQAGVGGVIAGLGTAFTHKQAKLLKRFATRVILNFDADAAGFKAARTTIETLLAIDLDIGVVSLPDKQDPDDFIKANGVAAYKEHLDKARDFYDFLMEYLAGDEDLDNNPRKRSDVLGELVHTLHKIADPVVQNHWLERLAEDLALPTEIVREVFESKRPKEDKKKDEPRQEQGPTNAIQEQMQHAPYGGSGWQKKGDWKGKGKGNWKKKFRGKDEWKNRIGQPYPEITTLHGDFSAKAPLPAELLSETLEKPAAPLPTANQEKSATPTTQTPEPIQSQAPPTPQAPPSIPEPEPMMPIDDVDALHEDDLHHHLGISEAPIKMPEPPPEHLIEPPDMNHLVPMDDFGHHEEDEDLLLNLGIPEDATQIPTTPPKNLWPPPAQPRNQAPIPQPPPAQATEAPARKAARRPAFVVTGEMPFDLLEREFLYIVMHNPNYAQDLSEEHQKMLHQILHHVYHDKNWLLEFINDDHNLELETTLQVVPEEVRNHLRAIYFDEAFEEFFNNEDINRMEQLFPELMAKMLHTLTERNKHQIRLLPPTEIKKKQALMKQNNEWRKQLHHLKTMRT